MHRRRFLSAAVLFLSFTLCLCLAACGNSFDESDETYDLLSALELETLDGCTELDLRNRTLTAQQYRWLTMQAPDCEILWNVPFQGGTYLSDSRNLTVKTLNREDIQFLRFFPKLEHLQVKNCPEYAVVMQLATEHPDLKLEYPVPFCGESVSCDVTSLTIPGDQVEAAASMLPYFQNLAAITFADPLPEPDQIRALQESYPHIDFSWSVTFRDKVLDHTVTTLDLTGVPLSVKEAERLIAYLPDLTYLDMTDCGIDNEQMDALNRKYENIKIVWTVSIGPFIRIKTDTTWFMAAKFGYTVATEDVYNLRYCTDIIAIDLGHMKITNCDFVAFMPHLKYLILADTKVTDLTPLTGLQELVYLELFYSDVQDYGPLETLTALEDLNLHYTQGSAEVISRITWLKNLWWNRCSDQDQKLLREAIPDCHFNFTALYSTAEGWRKLPNYYAQRDIFGMHYMND